MYFIGYLQYRESSRYIYFFTTDKMNNSTVASRIGDSQYFYLLNLSGIVCLTASDVCCIIALYHAFLHPWNNRSKITLLRRPIGERLVIYLIIASFGFCTSNVVNVSYELHIQDMPPPLPCSWIGFFVVAFTFVYQIIYISIAVTALMAVKRRKRGKPNKNARLDSSGYVIWNGIHDINRVVGNTAIRCWSAMVCIFVIVYKMMHSLGLIYRF